MVRSGRAVPLTESPVDSAFRKFPKRRRPWLIRAMGEDEFLHQKTRLNRHRVCSNLVVVFFLNPGHVRQRRLPQAAPSCEAA